MLRKIESKTVSESTLVTISKAAQNFEHLVQQLAPHGKLLRTWPLQGGISAQMTALELALPDGQTQKMIVRRPDITEQTLREHYRFFITQAIEKL